MDVNWEPRHKVGRDGEQTDTYGVYLLVKALEERVRFLEGDNHQHPPRLPKSYSTYASDNVDKRREAERHQEYSDGQDT